MRYEEFFREARQRNLRLSMKDPVGEKVAGLDNEALFQLPLLAMVILTLSKGRSKPKVSEIGQLVGECLERTVAGFKGSSQYIGWSANLRIRTIHALSFLEKKGFAVVEPSKKAISATETGRVVIDAAFDGETPLAFALATIERSFENIRAERGILEEVE
jgi:hypothetical protein